MSDQSVVSGTACPRAPVAIVLLALNEAHHMDGVLRNVVSWAQEIFVVDSLSSDRTVDIARSYGVHVVQRPFRGFGDQWNFALRELPITAPWTMKLDPDERVNDELKAAISRELSVTSTCGLRLWRRLWFMGTPLPVRDLNVRVWRTGCCHFTDVLVNEHPVVDGEVRTLDEGELEHYDSPDLNHWYEKQNRYSTSEALSRFKSLALGFQPRLLGSPQERRMWLKKNFWKMPGRYALMYAYHLIWLGAWRAGRPGRIWARLRTDVFRMQEYKLFEMESLGRVPRQYNGLSVPASDNEE